MKFGILDLEADALLEEVTKIHCVCISVYENNILLYKKVATTYPEMISLLEDLIKDGIYLVGHNIILYDLPVIKKILNYTFKGLAIDTLPLSWYFYPNRPEHGLESWGKTVGVAKPLIEDWKEGTLDSYIIRCETDVIINTLIFGDFLCYGEELYGNADSFLRLCMYLTWKMDCAAEQQENPLTIDRKHCVEVLTKLTEEISNKKTALALAMPFIKKFTEKNKPSKMFTVKGDLTKAGEAWLNLLADNDLDPSFEGSVSVIKSVEKPNPTSNTQLKSWLFTLGWQPTIFKYVPNKAGEVRPIPQLQTDDKKLCPNIIVLAETYPVLNELKGLFLLQHRIGVLEGFLECSNDLGKMVAQIGGLTNTLRFKHRKPIANLPSVNKPYGKEIRGAIIAPSPKHYFCGSDMSSLEDTTKQHYMMFYDPEYVKAMRIPGFDPHIDIGVLSNMLTQEQANKFKDLDSRKDLSAEENLEFANLKKIRGKAKVVNFSGIYGAGPPKIALTTGMSLQEATLLHKIYWDRNKSVKQIANDAVTKVIRNQMWLYNPVSSFWYSLRQPKDKFSTLNQGTGVYCFDTNVRNIRQTGIKISLQYHDEIGFAFLKTEEESIKAKLNMAIVKTNEQLKLNVPLGISIDIGDNYAEAH
jgi:hypothetical protein